MGTEAQQAAQPEVKPDEGSVTVEGMSSALKDLVKAADATDLINKGDANNVEHSGRVDESGKGGGGRATTSDAGGLDKMMIAKMSEAGVDVGMIAAFNDFMVGKAKKKDDDEEEENGDKGNGGDMAGYKKSEGEGTADPDPLLKSMDDFKSDPDIAGAVDVSPFLEALTVKVADQVDGMRKAVADGNASQSNVNQHMAAAMHQMGSLLKSQDVVITELAKRLDIVAREPNQQKGKTDLSSAQALNKGMPGEAGGPDPLSKGELVATLTYMNLEKGIKNIGSQPTSEAAMLLETGNILSKGVEQAAQSFLATNPNEAQVARTYC